MSPPCIHSPDISISGLHITMIAGLFSLGAGALWRCSFFTGWQLPLLLPAQKVAALAGAVAALLYVLLAGFGVPAQRTLYMLIVVAVALWLGRITSILHVLCLALGVVVLLDPWAVLWPQGIRVRSAIQTRPQPYFAVAHAFWRWTCHA